MSVKVLYENKESKAICPFCGSDDTIFTQYLNYIEITHEEYKCNICEKTFFRLFHYFCNSDITYDKIDLKQRKNLLMKLIMECTNEFNRLCGR